jgi:hypothetical protein
MPGSGITNSYFTGAPFAAAAVLYLNGKLTATKHNYKPALKDDVVGEQ